MMLLKLLLSIILLLGYTVLTHAGSKPTKKTKKPKSKMSDSSKPEEVECVIADSKAGYYYTLLVTQYLTNVDIFANDVEDRNEVEYYNTYVVPMQAEDIFWDIDGGTGVNTLAGTEKVQGLLVNFSTREFSFHQWSHFEVCYKEKEHIISLRYHGVAREEGGNNQDIFGIVRVTFDSRDLVDNVHVSPFETIDRGY